MPADVWANAFNVAYSRVAEGKCELVWVSWLCICTGIVLLMTSHYLEYNYLYMWT